MAGRLPLIKSVLQSIPTYQMQLFLIPKGTSNKIDKLLQNFLWGFDTEKAHRLHLKAWEDITLPKELDKLGIRRLTEMNNAMITKLNWQICTEDQKIWVQLVRDRYLRGRRRLDFDQTHKTCSWILGGITMCRRIEEKLVLPSGERDGVEHRNGLMAAASDYHRTPNSQQIASW